MILYINACVRAGSRTNRLARCLLEKLGDEVSELRLSEQTFSPTDEDFLTQRDELAARGDFDHPIFTPARQFAAADTVVIAAPFWDLSFPAALKQYFEKVNAVGVTFRYSPEGVPVGLCRAKRLYYVTTAGGPIFSDAYGFGYVKALAEGFYQIPEVRCVKAEGLDVLGADVEGILCAAEHEIDRMLKGTERQ